MPLTESGLILNQELAAWVQALGSVFAIFVAVAIPLYFDRKRRSDAIEIEQNQKQKFLITLLPTLYQLRDCTRTFLQVYQQQSQQEMHALHSLESNYLKLIPVFAKELHIFVHSNIYDEQLNQLAFELFHSEEILSQYLKNPNQQQWLPLQQKLTQHATQIESVTTFIIEKTEKHYAP